MTFDRDSVTNEDLRALHRKAAAAGDDAMVRDCEAALDGDCEAAERCIDAIEAAWHIRTRFPHAAAVIEAELNAAAKL